MGESRRNIPILQVERLIIVNDHGSQRKPIISDIQFTIKAGQTLAIVGESGSGKSVTASAIAGLLPQPLKINNGSIRWHGEDIIPWSSKEKQKLRGSEIGWMFQDFEGSLTPFMRIGKAMEELIMFHQQKPRRQAREIAINWLELMELPVERIYRSYPFQLSGGQCQRVALACALMLEPSLLIADEPTTALDVLTGEAILDLIKSMQKKTGCAVLLISHDLRQVIKHSEEMVVMKKGAIVEAGPTEILINYPQHEYTKALLKACPRITNNNITARITNTKQSVTSLDNNGVITFY
ncbi:ABC transporter ATP-binding protein [Paenibacillus sp. GSMTC-2017]|uniref:ABC transporter ATP-binding protein n=1 Tax=Paenibacillus sp. GSMTC-2017 TaxID=2794350 RepID=UPI0018D7B149|nr:ABC transporter ATP-binding protein [Paenibacillus sp. GSMTC-2017]MBH5316993.1 ABC transporter ATP-binding protein [Paenibacillus sp. GSMTC-2017]